MRRGLLCLMAAGLAWGSQPYRARHAMVVSAETNASEIGVQVLEAGGNAMDAAVAVGFALGVTHSGMNGLGGGGYILVRLKDGRTSFFDFRERAPGKATRDLFLGPDLRGESDRLARCRRAGNVRGFELAHRNFGTRPWGGAAPAGYPARSQGLSSFQYERESIPRRSEFVKRS